VTGAGGRAGIFNFGPMTGRASASMRLRSDYFSEISTFLIFRILDRHQGDHEWNLFDMLHPPSSLFSSMFLLHF